MTNFNHIFTTLVTLPALGSTTIAMVIFYEREKIADVDIKLHGHTMVPNKTIKYLNQCTDSVRKQYAIKKMLTKVKDAEREIAIRVGRVFGTVFFDAITVIAK